VIQHKADEFLSQLSAGDPVAIGFTILVAILIVLSATLTIAEKRRLKGPKR